MARTIVATIGVLLMFICSAHAVPPASQPAAETSSQLTTAQIQSRIDELQQKLASLPGTSPDHAAVASELMRLRQSLRSAPVSPIAPVPQSESQAGLPPKTYADWRKANIDPLEERIRYDQREMSKVSDPTSRKRGADAIAGLRIQIAAKEKQLVEWMAQMKAKYPNGADPCATCNGKGQIQHGSTYIPPTELPSGRMTGGLSVANTVKCPTCKGEGWIAKEGPSNQAVAGAAEQKAEVGSAPKAEQTTEARCPRCDGSGRAFTHVTLGDGRSAKQDLGPCRQCNGTGTILVAAGAEGRETGREPTPGAGPVKSPELLHPVGGSTDAALDRRETDLLLVVTNSGVLTPDDLPGVSATSPVLLKASGSRVTIGKRGQLRIASRLWDKADVICLHPHAPTVPARLDFSKVTTGRSGALELNFHNYPGGDSLAVLLVDEAEAKRVSVAGDEWRTVSIPFDHKPVVLEVRATGWNLEHAFVTYNFRAADANASAPAATQPARPLSIAPVTQADIAARRQQLLDPIDAQIKPLQLLWDQMSEEARNHGGTLQSRLSKLKAEREKLAGVPDEQIAASIRAQREQAAATAEQARQKAAADADRVQQQAQREAGVKAERQRAAEVQQTQQRQIAADARDKAASGDAAAMATYGQCLIYGQGVPVDEAAGLDWLKRAADKNHVGACSALALHYEMATRGQKDRSEAIRWYRKAASLGDIHAGEAADTLARWSQQPAESSGKGTEPVATETKECPTCFGKGQILVLLKGGGNSDIDKKRGTASVKEYDTCPTCGGTGRVPK